jgi:hypothetical protein
VDAAVLDAYGWSPDLTDEQLLSGLVELNTKRAAQEGEGVIRWLRPEYEKSRTGVDERDVLHGPGVRKSAPPKGPGIAAARATKTAPKARGKWGGKRC